MIPILLYHQIAPRSLEQDPQRLAVPPQQFERQMAYLHRAGYRCLGLQDATAYMNRGLAPPRKSFVLTFDDGYRDLYSTVWPILQRFDFLATIFLVADRVGSQSDWKGQRGSAAAPLLSWKEARELASKGFTFASHTLTHPRLTQLDHKRALHEIRQSRVAIEEQLGEQINLFSYPYHDFDVRIQRMVAESGYTAACGGQRGAWGRFNLWRAECMQGERLLSFALKVGGQYFQLIRLREQTRIGQTLRASVSTIRRWRSSSQF